MFPNKLCATLNHSRHIPRSLWAGFVKPALASSESSTHWTKSVRKTRQLRCKQLSNSHLSLPSYIMCIQYPSRDMGETFGLKQISGLTRQYSVCTFTPTILAQAKGHCLGVKRPQQRPCRIHSGVLCGQATRQLRYQLQQSSLDWKGREHARHWCGKLTQSCFTASAAA